MFSHAIKHHGYRVLLANRYTQISRWSANFLDRRYTFHLQPHRFANHRTRVSSSELSPLLHDLRGIKMLLTFITAPRSWGSHLETPQCPFCWLTLHNTKMKAGRGAGLHETKHTVTSPHSYKCWQCVLLSWAKSQVTGSCLSALFSWHGMPYVRRPVLFVIYHLH